MIYSNVEISQYLAEKVPHLHELSLARVKAHYVGCVSLATDTVKEAWTAYRCLNAELSLQGKTYILSNGKWYRIDNDFVQEINQYMATIAPCALALPQYQDATEGAYSARVAQHDPDFVLLDRNTGSVWRRQKQN
jgi:uncharacterized protein (TIGR04141 family)